MELLKPSEQLAYIIGVVLGGGCVSKKRRVIKGYNDFVVGLKAKDKEFLKEFGRCLAGLQGDTVTEGGLNTSTTTSHAREGIQPTIRQEATQPIQTPARKTRNSTKHQKG